MKPEKRNNKIVFCRYDNKKKLSNVNSVCLCGTLHMPCRLNMDDSCSVLNQFLGYSLYGYDFLNELEI